MLFTTAPFFVLLAAAVALHWALPWQRGRLAVLLAASFYFYAFHHWPSLILLIGFILFNYFAALAQEKWRGPRVLALAVSVNLLALGWFKYAAFLAEIVQLVTRVPVPHPPVFLPLGISFFTFQVVAYQVDVHRGEIAAERSLLRFAVFKCFFAQLIAGPIVRAHEFLPQLREKRRFDAEGFHHGLFLLAAGLALKLGVADVLAQFVREDFAEPGRLASTEAWTGIYAFAFQLYADFWGYSTMAVGIGLLFGLVLPLNFHSPYLSQSLQEFWRRWHVTLSSWFRDYLYIPLGGNRRHAGRNLLVTLGVAGLWHGAGFTFVIWGLAHGAWLWLERRLRGRVRLPRPARIFLVFHGVCLLWVLFRAPDLRSAVAYLGRLLLPPWNAAPVPGLLLTWLIGFALLQAPIAALIEDRCFLALRIRWQVAATAALLLFALAHAGARIDFIYFTF
jgi:D-alanyl-lipoteichoic acid acyltransferase DltB (MBOAT superfamily)